jgi:hypothetical protein
MYGGSSQRADSRRTRQDYPNWHFFLKTRSGNTSKNPDGFPLARVPLTHGIEENQFSLSTIAVLPDLSDPSGFFGRAIPLAENSQIYNTAVTNIPDNTVWNLGRFPIRRPA